jgi:Ion channel
MDLLPTLLLSVLGVGLIALALRDIFDVLFHLEGRASVSRFVTRNVWRAMRRASDVRPQLFPIAGPVGLVATIAVWAILLLVGWALLIWPHLASFETAAGESTDGGFWEALHISGGVLSTMGFGDVTPVEQWLRVLSPLEALLGFGLLTASVTWLFAVHPAVQRRRALAYELWLVRQASDGDYDAPIFDEELFNELTSRIIAVQRDIVAIPASYYFRDPDERLLLSAELPFLRDLVRHVVRNGRDTATVQRARMCSQAIDDLLLTIARRLHGRDDVEPGEGLRMFARDHLKRELPE